MRLKRTRRQKKKQVAVQASGAMWLLLHCWWVGLIAQLRAEGLLQQPVGHGRFSWTTVSTKWVGVFARSHNLASSFAERLTHGDVEQLCTLTCEMGAAHRALLLPITLRSHIFVDHLVEYPATLVALVRFGAFRGEERHKVFKVEIRRRSFKAGRRRGWTAGGGGGGLLRKSYAEVIRDDNLDQGLGHTGLAMRLRHRQSKPSTSLGMLLSQKIDHI